MQNILAKYLEISNSCGMNFKNYGQRPSLNPFTLILSHYGHLAVIFKKLNCVTDTSSTDLGFMQYLEHLLFLEYLLGVEHERGRNANGRRSIFDVM